MTANSVRIVAFFAFPDGAWDLEMALSIALLGLGFFVRGPSRHAVRSAGWILFGLYWPFQAPHFFETGDPVNGWFSLLGPVVLLYFVYHEYLSWKWNEDAKVLRWLSGTASIAAATFFIFTWIPALSLAIEYFVGVQTQWMLTGLFGVPASTVIQPDPSGNLEVNVYLNHGASSVYAVTIILACTAIQSMMIFVGAIATLDAPRDRKLRGYILTVPLIHLLNLFRNAGIVYGYQILQWNPFNWGGPDPGGFLSWFWDPSMAGQGLAQGSFEWMHSYVGKWGSLAALVLIALAVFALLPELHSYILDVFDLPKRRRPGFFAPARDPAAAATPPASAPVPSGAIPTESGGEAEHAS